jgi:hypothetical protein
MVPMATQPLLGTVMIDSFRIEVPEAALVDLRERLERVRWPAQLPGDGWQRGVPVAYLQRITDYWLRSYDWRSWEARLNEYPQFITRVDGQTITSCMSDHPSPTPYR